MATAENELRWGLGNLQNTRDVTIAGMQGANNLALENLRGQYTSQNQQAQIQQQQWAQTFGTASDFERMRLQYSQEEMMAQWQQQLAREAWLEQQPLLAQRDVLGYQYQDWQRQRDIEASAMWQNFNQASQFARQSPLEQYAAETQRFSAAAPYSPYYQNQQNFTRALSNITQGISQYLPQMSPENQQAMLSNLLNNLGGYFGVNQFPNPMLAYQPPAPAQTPFNYAPLPGQVPA